MSLTIYTKRSNVPNTLKVVNYNDKFFSSIELRDDAVSKNILEEIDHARYNSKDTFIGRDESLGALNKSFLSTGCKTLLNIVSNPHICFDVIECGQNALRLLTKIKEGNVVWEYPVILISDAEECDIVINNKRFTDTMQLAEYVTNLMLGEDLDE